MQRGPIALDHAGSIDWRMDYTRGVGSGNR
jgi:hypothetical protein